MHRLSDKPMPLWKIVLLWLIVGVGCVAWTYTGEPAEAPSTGTCRA